MKRFVFAVVLAWLFGVSSCQAQEWFNTVTTLPRVERLLNGDADAQPATTIDPERGDWELVFADEFEETTLDPTRWTTCYWWDDDGCTIATNNELQWYQPDNVRVDRGLLILQAEQKQIKNNQGKRFDYTSGMISSGYGDWEKTTPLRFAFHYGYAEIRARLPTGKGLWSAFWLLPTTNESLPEIDILEVLGHQADLIEMNFHYQAAKLRDQEIVRSFGDNWHGPDFAQGWHTFGVDWQPGHLVWYVDRVERMRYARRQFIPDQPMYLIANLAVGGDWPGAPDKATRFPAQLEIDYIRVWQSGR